MKTQYAADKPSDCRYCYYWKNKRTGCSLGKANCYYRISPPPKLKSDCDGYKDGILIDLTIAKESNYEDINALLEQCGKQIVDREITKGYVCGLTKG
ncbi:MAG: hypothetical protein PUE19_08350, partial [bacterium]|nr:hypothetical protein [bacterium]